ncbi:MAG: class I SAM-dependent methyltransferase [Burkholderiales bacterium]|nr:class I SAM-dependent methyltransferase [Burkholderiales bacterium]
MPAEGPQPDYAAHDAVYQRLRGQPQRSGWDTYEELARALALLDDVLDWKGFPRSGDLLEIGCGAGNVSLHLAAKGYRVRGLDIAPTAVAWARDNARSAALEARFDVGDVLSLASVADASMDVVLDGHCLHCILGEDRARVFASVRRVLKPGGVFLLRSMCNEPPPSFSAEALANRHVGRAPALLQEMEAAGFSLLEWQVVPAQDGNDLDELFALAAPQ